MIKYNLLTISQIYELELAVIMYKYHKNIQPHQQQNIFKMNNSQIKTRSHSKIIMNYCKFTTSQQSIKFAGPKLWLKVPTNIKKSTSTKIFATKMKKHILTTAQYSTKTAVEAVSFLIIITGVTTSNRCHHTKLHK